MQVPRFSPRISLIEMALRATPRSSCPGRPALPPPRRLLQAASKSSERVSALAALPCLLPQTDTAVALIYKYKIT
jgi:hypothetical protein